MSHRTHFDKIEQYHTGSMAAEERMLFEKELAADPTLQSESDFQAEIINGLKEYRKSQLKARLDAIEVFPGWLEFAQQSALVKSFGGIAVATAIGTGVYYVAANSEEVELPVKEIELVEGEIDAPVAAKAIAFELDWSQIEASPVSQERKKSLYKAEFVKVSNEHNNDANYENNSDKSVVINFSAPSVDLVSEESEGLFSHELEKVEVNTSARETPTPIDIKTEITKGNKLKYKYFDGKLFLTGNFKDKPYEILEINGAEGRRIYLLHDNKYYELSLTDKLIELPEVRNIKLIQELRLIKAGK